NRVRRHYLNDGDVVLVGKHELIYVDERAARTRSAFTETVPGVQTEAEAEAAPAGDEDDADAEDAEDAEDAQAR
ncbi:MAG TPA: hypothetical protein VG011_11055, partial [Steroidobacteraceae bacterium]|nr:hypothetical protein [Steroidobacteraceae bacterium]